MKKYLFLVILSFFSVIAIQGQFTDNLETYVDGVSVCNDIWGIEDVYCLLPSDDQARTGSLSGYIPDDGSSNTFLDLGNFIFGTWALQFYMYVPTEREAVWNFQGSNSVNLEESVVGNIFFNKDAGDLGVGFIDWGTTDVSDDTYFNFPHDTWFWIGVFFDFSLGISAATWEFGVDGVVVLPAGTAFENGDGLAPSSLGGINFKSNSANSHFYFDDFCYVDPIDGIIPDCFPLSTNEIEAKEFSLNPNPTTGILLVQSEIGISTIEVYNHLGQLVGSKSNDNMIDISKLNQGLYYVKILNESGATGVKKVIKN